MTLLEVIGHDLMLINETTSAINRFSFRYAGGSLPTLPRDLGNRLLDIVKLDDYQEPYQALKYAPYYSYSTVVMEMKDMMLNNKGTNINHSGMRRSNASTPTFATTRTRTRSCGHAHTHTYVRICTHPAYNTFKCRGSCANGHAPTYVPATKHSPWPQSIRHPLLRSLLLCYIIRSGVRERCSWHVVRLCGTGTRHCAPA